MASVQRTVEESSMVGLFHGKGMKVEVPRFNGKEADDWIFKIKEFFEIYGVPMEQRIKIASFHMEGTAYSWYKWVTRNELVQSWTEFLTALQLRFGTSLYDDPKAALKELKQTATVSEYQSKFEEISTKVTGLGESWLVSFFIAGLNDHLKCDLLLAQPGTYYQAVSLAKLHEQKLLTMQNSLKNSSSRGSVSAGPQKSPGNNSTYFLSNNKTSSWGSGGFKEAQISNQGGSKQQGSSSSSSSSTNSNIKKLSAAELKARREKGLCYYCDEKYQPNHRCKTNCFLLVGQEEIEDLLHEEEAPNDDQENEGSHVQLLEAAPEINMNALEGHFHPSTLRLVGRHGKKQVKILIDNGSNNNFIKPEVADKLSLKRTPTTEFKVWSGSGIYLTCNYKCEGVSLIIQGNEFTVDLYVLNIKGSEIVLGVQWLIELGTIKTNYQNLSMEFIFQGRTVTLQGDNILISDPFRGKKLSKIAAMEGISELYQLHTITEYAQEDKNKGEVPEVIQEVLHQYEEVFQEPKSLPPVREVDHRIPLEPSSKPVNVRPYKYPYFQKNEMERLVTEMLNAGIIRDIRSPFSSPVLLVKKKDGTWRFCVDYQALNNITVKDRFPIPTIEEILDELHDTTHFSKLDLRSGYHQIRMWEPISQRPLSEPTLAITNL